MTTKDVQDLARLIGKVPGIKSVELKDVRQLAELLHEFPEIGSIEVRGFFDTGVVITRTGSGAPQAAPVHAPAPLPAAPVAVGPAACLRAHGCGLQADTEPCGSEDASNTLLWRGTVSANETHQALQAQVPVPSCSHCPHHCEQGQ